MSKIIGDLCMTLHPLLVILREVAGSMQCVDCIRTALQ